LDLKIARKEKKLYHVHTEDLNADYALGKGNNNFNSYHRIFQFNNTKILLFIHYIIYYTISFRIVRAFLIEEQKVVKKVLAEMMKKGGKKE